MQIETCQHHVSILASRLADGGNLNVAISTKQPQAEERMSLRIERISDLGQLSDSLRREWNSLPMPSPMQSADWLTAWWRSYGEKNDRLCLLLIFEGNQLVGVAPWYITKAWGAANCLRFLGDGAVCSDHATILFAESRGDAVTSALTEWINVAAGTLFHTATFESIDNDEQPTRQLLERLHRSGCESSERSTVGCWTFDLPSTWDEFLASLSKNHRKRCRRWYRDYFETGRAETRSYSANEVQVGWNEIAELNLERRQHVGDRSAFVDERFHQFHLSVLPDLVASGRAELRSLRVDGELAAAEYILLHNQTVFCYQSGMRTSDQRDGYGNLSILSLLHDSISRGHRRLDFLRGDESYKQHWGATRAGCADHFVATPSLKGTAHAVYNRTYDWLRETFANSSA